MKAYGNTESFDSLATTALIQIYCKLKKGIWIMHFNKWTEIIIIKYDVHDYMYKQYFIHNYIVYRIFFIYRNQKSSKNTHFRKAALKNYSLLH